MSQHDMDLANGSGASFRADLNVALGALATCQSGTSAPSPTFPNQFWYDSTNGILKKRNNANSAWEDFGPYFGTFTPTFTFTTPGNLVVAYSQQTGFYQKVGRLVIATYNIVTSTLTHTTAAGAAIIGGFPFTIKNVGGYFPIGGGVFGGITKASVGSVDTVGVVNTTTANISGSGSGIGSASLLPADIPTGGTLVLRQTFIYEATT